MIARHAASYPSRDPLFQLRATLDTHSTASNSPNPLWTPVVPPGGAEGRGTIDLCHRLGPADIGRRRIVKVPRMVELFGTKTGTRDENWASKRGGCKTPTSGAVGGNWRICLEHQSRRAEKELAHIVVILAHWPRDRQSTWAGVQVGPQTPAFLACRFCRWDAPEQGGVNICMPFLSRLL